MTRRDEEVWREIGEAPPACQPGTILFPLVPGAQLRSAASPDRGRTSGHNALASRQCGGAAVGRRSDAGHPLPHADGRRATFHATQFIFCLGGIESSRFFLQPRAGGLPWNSSGLLGKHFQDHVDCNAATVEPIHAGRFHQMFDNVFSDGFKYHPNLRLAAAEQVHRHVERCSDDGLRQRYG